MGIILVLVVKLKINSDLGDFIRPADYSAKIYESQCPPGQTVTYTAITNCWVAYNTYGNSSGSNVMINDVQVDAAYTTDNFRANANGLLYLKREDIFSLHSEISSGGYRIYATI